MEAKMAHGAQVAGTRSVTASERVANARARLEEIMGNVKDQRDIAQSRLDGLYGATPSSVSQDRDDANGELDMLDATILALQSEVARLREQVERI